MKMTLLAAGLVSSASAFALPPTSRAAMHSRATMHSRAHAQVVELNGVIHEWGGNWKVCYFADKYNLARTLSFLK